MIVLVLAAVVIVWGVVTNLIDTQSEQVDVSSKCLLIDIKATKLECGGASNDVCDITVSRNAQGEDIAGIKLVFTNTASDNNFVYDLPGNINLLETKTVTSITTGLVNTSNVEIIDYFTDAL